MPMFMEAWHAEYPSTSSSFAIVLRRRPSVGHSESVETLKSSIGCADSSAAKYGRGSRSHTTSESESSTRTPVFNSGNK